MQLNVQKDQISFPRKRQSKTIFIINMHTKNSQRLLYYSLTQTLSSCTLSQTLVSSVKSQCVWQVKYKLLWCKKSNFICTNFISILGTNLVLLFLLYTKIKLCKIYTKKLPTFTHSNPFSLYTLSDPCFFSEESVSVKQKYIC